MRDADKLRNLERDQTDNSLRVERNNADNSVGEIRVEVEKVAAEVLRVARSRADQVVQVARDQADRNRTTPSASSNASVDGERARADALLQHERSQADRVSRRERTVWKRYLEDFLAVEREATDANLSGERDRADIKLAARDEFLRMVSHDVRSLLTALSLNSELLFSQAPEGQVGDSLRTSATTSKRLVARTSRLVNDLLDIASIESGKLALFPEPVDVAQLLRETLESFAPIAASKGIVLDGDGAGLPLFATLDGERILQVLANLVSNAIKFTAAGGAVSIRVRGAADRVEFAVIDSGIGIADDQLGEVFERFKQVRPNRYSLGLGLHIAKCIVEVHGGTISAESQLGAGSTFRFSVPAA